MSEDTVTRKEALMGLLSYIKKYWIMLVLSIVFSLLYVLLSLYVPRLIGDGTDAVIGKGKVDFTILADVGIKIAASAIMAALSQWLMGLCNNRITYNVVRDIRKNAFKKIQKLPLSYLDKKEEGDIASRIIADTDQLSDGLLLGFSQLFTSVCTIIFTLVFMLIINWQIALVVIIITPLSIFVANFIAKHTYAMYKKQSETRGEQTALIDEAINGSKVVKAFGQEANIMEDFDRVNKKLEKYYIKGTFYSSITNPATRFVNNIVYMGVAVVGGLTALLTGGITVGGLTCILSYASQYTKPFNEISSVIAELQNAIACGSRVFSLMNAKEEKPDTDSKEMKDVGGKVDISDVYFSYIKGQHLIENLNIHIKPGEHVAIVGPTGCGKTTIINLLMRFYDTDSGCIRVDDNNIEDVKRRDLRKSYGMVLQDTWLKDGTVRENIAMARPDATMDEVVEAAKETCAHSFIKRLPKGYDTHLTEGGGLLSEGEKQLLCITRVMLCLPPMLILDEATSSIDTRTEIKVQNAFDKMMKGRTTFIVAHRLSTVRNADEILVMRDGKIVEQGKHDALMKKRGFYYEMYSEQYAVQSEKQTLKNL